MTATIVALGSTDEMAATKRRADRWVFAILIVGALLGLAMLAKPNDSGDIDRFEAEARSMLAGQGFALEAADAARYVGIPRSGPVTEHPPGYPVVIALLYLVWDSRWMLLATNWLMSTAAIYCLYRSLRETNCRIGVIAAALLAFNPWIVRWTSYLMAETLAVFLTSLLVWQISRVQRGVAGWPTALSVGLLAVGLLLTVPAMVFLLALIVLATGWYFRRQPAALAALAVGCLAFMVPWQVHCWRATGRIQPGILTHGERMLMRSNFLAWVNTWMDDTNQIHVFWNTDFFDEIPADVFVDDAERERLRDDAGRWANRGDDFEAIEAEFAAAAERRKAELSPQQLKGVLPFWRGVTLWTHHQRLLWREGWQMRAVDLACNLVNWFYLAVFVVLCLVGVRSGQPFALAIVAGTLIYTAYNGFVGLEEFRRNYPFYPALFFLACYWSWPSGAGSAGTDPKGSSSISTRI